MIERLSFDLPEMETPFRKIVVQYPYHEETYQLCPTMTVFRLLATKKLLAVKLFDLNVDGVPVRILDLFGAE